jgi:hypothetical protein
MTPSPENPPSVPPTRTLNPTEKAIFQRLVKGHQVSDIAKDLSIAPRTVYSYCSKHGWPTNLPLVPNSPSERKILRALVALGFQTSRESAIHQVSLLYKQAPICIERLINDCKRRAPRDDA